MQPKKSQVADLNPQASRLTPDVVGVCALCGGMLSGYCRKDGVLTGRCRLCGLVQVAFQNAADRQGWRALYGEPGRYHKERVLDGFHSVEQRFQHDLRLARIRVVNLKRFCSKGSLLDVGCSNGALVSVAQSLGFQAEGLEMDPWTAEQARKLAGCPIVCADFEHWESGKVYDVITLIDAFEHLLDPTSAMEKLRRLLTGRGLLVLEMPDADEPGFQEQGPHWKHFKPREHAFFYGNRHVRRLLRGNGFEVLDSFLPYPDRRTYYARTR